ncbi:MAG: hypothetical protein ACYCSQ_06640 [bacterium]
MKKIKPAILVLMFGVLGLGLYGCANKYNSVPLHSVKYYVKHQKKMTAVINRCQNMESGIHSFKEADRFHKSNLYKDCSNAQAAKDSLARKSLGKSIASGW